MNAILERLDKIEDSLSNQAKERWLNIKGVSDYSSLSIPKIRRAVKSGELKVSKNGGRLLFKASWVDKWLND
tara:strand:- start:2941 stop:3156 length:216 start_codon:yes stop_codon:yes gene_type:complete